ncbi:hypothetical protein [uncultured Imperialibacter sp.]|uniref:hypothetical protein n=1 Tax=uncultured Imperialibacter sp. TaxID=1672639 RepID=UPI0030DD800E|tara:strand:+ start:34651 stop:35202 length:552 start_codon:yes stop_codon:yes gene_type:complete
MICKFGSSLSLTLLVSALTLKAQNDVSTSESLEWINSKISNYSIDAVITGTVDITDNDELLVIDVRGNSTSNLYYTLQKIKLSEIYSINLRNESDYVAIDLIPKVGQSVEIRDFITEQNNLPIAEIRNNLAESLFTNQASGKLTKLQISLRSSSRDQDIGSRIIKAFKQILSIKNISLPDEKF